MPKWLVVITMLLVVLAMIPPALIARQRAIPFTKSRIHIIQDMDDQAKLKTQNPALVIAGRSLFNDGRSMRPPLEGVIARGDLMEDAHYYKGVVGNEWVTTFPTQIPVTRNLLRRGQERFNIYCQPCHGAAGYGDGIVNQRAMRLMDAPLLGNGTIWVQPKSIHEEAIREQPVGQIFNSITNGVRNMSGYASQIPVEDRWAIVAYAKALQRSQHAREADLSPRERAELGDPIDRRPLTEEGGED
jgi:mono/diheme cytochrome c family protein